MRKILICKAVFLIFLYSLLLLSSCELFYAETDPDFWKKLDEEIAWANARKLEVRIAIPFGWGTSNPGVGIIRTVDIRKGEGERYAFDVEFTPDSGFGFRGWLAFTNSVYAVISSSLNTMSFETARDNSLNGKGVMIIPRETHSASFISRVTINISEQIILVPFCDTRPQVDRSNPPLVPAISPFPYDQRITLWFNMGIDTGTVKIGETIRITAIDRAGNNVGNNGDISDYFEVREYDTGENRLIIAPKNETPAQNLQLLNISVEIGSGIKNAKGLEMPAVQTITYLTDSSQAQKIYEASNIRASRDGNLYYGDFGTSWQDPLIDRRFNKGKTDPDYNTVHLRFSVIVPEGAPSEPNTVRIFERLYSDLSGFAISPAIVEGGEEGFNYPLPPPEAGIYSINHSLQTGNSGIIQLIVISWNDSSGEETFRQARDTAIAAGQFVTIVMDNAPPRMSDLGAELNGRLNNKGIYDFARNSSFFLTLNRLHLLSDNGTDGGIHFSEAFNKPWTMDDRSHLRWRVSVTDTADPPFTAIAPSEWQPVTNNIFPTSSGGQSLSGLDENKVYDVWVELRDRMENISRTKATSLEIVAGTPVAVTGLEAECVPSGNQIKASWTTPANDASMIGAQVYVNGRLEATVTGTSGSYPFNVTPIVTTGVSTGQSVTGVTRYDIEVIAFNAAGDAAAEKLTIWNIPEMNVSQSNPAIELTQTDFSSKLSADARTYVLTQNITLATDWIPVGTGSGTDAFRGKFYGNGYTIKVDGDPPKNRGIVGIFGFVENAEIRDLRVEYNSIEAGASNYFGGIAGYARYATVIRNIIVDGSVTSVDGSFNSSSLSVGMIVGDMQAGVEIDNCYAALNLSLNADVSGTYTGGGIAGESSGIIRNSVVSGILKMASASSGNHIIGGIVGNMTGGSIESCNSSAAINIPNTHSASGLTIVGGVAGRIDADESITVSNTVANGDITVASKGTGEIVMGGVCGISMEATAANKISFENCEYSGKVISFNRDKTGPGDFVTIGGFIGDVGNHTGFTNCRSLSLIKVDTKTEINTSTNLEQLKIGGFAGLLKSGIKECYSTTSIEVTIKSTDNIVGTTIPETTRHSFGGFVGTMENLSTANQCYATGSITVTSYENESYRYFAGGFVGVIFTNVTVKNCYATGHIMVDRIDPSAKGLIDVGGFGGSMRHPTEAGTHHGTDSKIKYCFSVGSFTAKSCGSDGSAGGLVSYIYQQSTIKSCVVLGEYVSTQGSGNNIGRISGYPQINSTWENNYAADRLLLYKTAYDVIDSQPTALSPSGTTTNQNGGTINWGMIDSSFYRDKLGFSEEIWDLGTPVTRNKWPTLRGVGGQ